MRRVLIALLLLTVPLAGCVDGGPTVTSATVPYGTLATYEIEAGGAMSEETYVFVPTDDGYDLEPHNTSQESWASPFLRLNEQLSPRAFNWSGLFQFPISPGDSYDATVGGAEATVTLHATTVQMPNGTQDAIRADAEADGETIASITLLTDPTIPVEIDVDTPDGTDQTWTLTTLSADPGWNRPPAWTIGDWWSYDATTRDEHANLTLIYNAHDENTKGVKQRVLNAQTVDARIPALPFHKVRDHDIAPQSGFLSGLLSSFWSWPLEDGKTWTGDTRLPGLRSYVATVSLETGVQVPGDRYTTAYTITARDVDDPRGPPVAQWQYAPLVDMITHLWIEDPSSGERIIDWSLTDWGHGFHGTIEIPNRATVYGRNMTTGPTTVDDAFPVPEEADRLRIRGTAVRSQQAPKNITLSIHDPDGERAWIRNGSDFRKRVIQFDTAIDTTQGNWTFKADVPEGVSFFVQVRAGWVTTEQVDYR